MWLLITSALTVVILLTIYFNIKHHFNYFKRKNVSHVEPTLILGNLKDLVLRKKDLVQWLNSLYHSRKAKHQPYIGFFVFHKPGILVREPELIKKIMIKDFQHFTNRHANIDKEHDSLAGNNIFFSKTINWKILRTKISPVFTNAKMKLMFTLFDEIGNNLNTYLNELTLEKGFASKEIHGICRIFTTDVIASVAFGVEANTLKDPTSAMKKQMEHLTCFSSMKTFDYLTIFFVPEFAKYFRPKFFSNKAKHFLETTIQSVIESREKGGRRRNDLIDLLIDLRKEAIEFSNIAITTQAALFFSAGFEFSSTIMSFALYELAKNQEVQKILRKEIRNTLSENEGMITYEVVTIGMPYLDCVIKEVLRLYPAVPFVDRVVTLLEGETKYSFEPFGNYKAPNGTPVYIPIVSIHRNVNFFRNPSVFDPDRFSLERRSEIIPGTYLPFGIGPRNCLGEQFGLIQVKIGLINFLKSHTLRCNTRSQLDIEFEKNVIVLQAKGGINLDIVRESSSK